MGEGIGSKSDESRVSVKDESRETRNEKRETRNEKEEMRSE